MKIRTLLLVLVVSLTSLLFFLTTASAQGNLGAITGTLQDASGAVVPEAAITITNFDTGVKWTAKTSSAGYYRVPVPPGSYRVQAERAGFKTAITDQIVVPVAQVVTVDLKLQPGSVKETVVVTAEASLLQTATAEVSSSVTPQEFETLPIQVSDGGRDLQSFIFSSLPGTVASGGDPTNGPWSGSINGGQLFSHEILIDGVTIGRFDLSGGGLTEFQPGTDSIAEFKVQSSNYSAEYGNTGGGVANFTYKSGTNQFHGLLFEYLKNPVANAAGVFPGAFPGTPKDNVKENNYGFNIGGPILKDRTFFFFNYEGDRYRDFSYNGQVTIPTVAMRTGDFSEMLGPQIQNCGPTEDQLCFDALNRPVYQGEIFDPTTTRDVGGEPVRDGFGFDPTTGLPIPGQANVIPAGMISTASAQLMPLFPDPLYSGTIKNTPRFSGCCPFLNRNAYTVKIDHVLNSKQKLWGSYTYAWRSRYNRNTTSFPPFPGWPMNPIKRQDVGGPQVRIAHAWNITDRSLNNFQFGFNRFQNKNGLSNNAKYFPSELVGAPSTCFPRIALSSSYIKNLPRTLGQSCPNIDPADSFIVQDYFSYLRGKHNLKFGGEFRHYRYNTYEPGSLSGSYSFSDVQTGLPGFTTSTGNPYASMVLGGASTASRSIYFTTPHFRAGSYSFFVQDDFKATPKLTLNLGLRWEIPVPQYEHDDRESGFNATLANPGADNIPGALEFLGNCSVCNHRHSFMDWNFKQFAPRIGVAYAITNKLVFRGGYGISFAPPIEDNFGTMNYWGFTDSVVVQKSNARKTTGFSQDPALYWSALASGTPPQNVFNGQAASIGIPAYTGALPNRDPALANGDTIDFLPRNATREPYTQNWSAGFQYMLPHDIMIQADYLGSKGTRLLNGYFGTLANQAQTKYMGLGDILSDDLATDLADPVNGPILASYGITGLPYPDFEDLNYDTSVSAAIQPYPQYYSIQNNYPNFGSSTYHSLQAMARKNASHGLTLIAAYTYSKMLTDSDAALFASGGQNVQDVWNRRAEKGIASYDHTHVFKLSWFYDLPFGRGRTWLNRGGALDRVVGGWQITAIQNYMSGNPLTLYSTYGSGYQSQYGIRGDVIPGVPQKVAHVGHLDVVNFTPYLNPAAFADPPASDINSYALRYGNSPPFLQTRGPAWIGEDFGVVKNTRLTERFTLQFRADMFNVFNRTRLGDPDTSLGDGIPEYDSSGANTSGGSFGTITGPQHGPRIIQFALRLTY